MSVTLNITMPVFNRYAATQKSLLALYKSSREIPFSITVVDNGSDGTVTKRLIELAEGGIIDKLFLLPRNMGISCAANIGWDMTPAPFYMKLDNDTVMRDPQWLPKLFRLWRHGASLSTLGGAYDKKMLLRNPGALHTEDGILGACPSNLPGQAILIPKGVSDILGQRNEDYGLYGTEDGDYGLRMNCASFPQYYYHGPDFFTDLHIDDTKETYLARGINKQTEQLSSFGRTGLFPANNALFNLCVRSWKVMRRYAIDDIYDKYHVHVVEREEYVEFRKDLDRVVALIYKIPQSEWSDKFIMRLKRLMAGHGQDCDSMPGSVS
ncbi:MAG: glycosyltransferase [Deltaproteobacteria bacterium]|jgi:glycosyltransferase involved in cell wall biosynthesis|nr:glycosyltransferase [Deltaproteobacteria bacterium]